MKTNQRALTISRGGRNQTIKG